MIGNQSSWQEDNAWQFNKEKDNLFLQCFSPNLWQSKPAQEEWKIKYGAPAPGTSE
jgi:hypothetical protein